MQADQVQERIKSEEVGVKKGKIEIATEMKKEGEPLSKIIRYAGLTAEEIERL